MPHIKIDQSKKIKKTRNIFIVPIEQSIFDTHAEK
jgi:hypothetical protein